MSTPLFTLSPTAHRRIQKLLDWDHEQINYWSGPAKEYREHASPEELEFLDAEEQQYDDRRIDFYTDAIFLGLQDGTVPWHVFHREDVKDGLSTVLANADIYSLEKIGATVSSHIDKLLLKVNIGFEIHFTPTSNAYKLMQHALWQAKNAEPSKSFPPPFSTKYHSSTGIQQVDAKVCDQEMTIMIRAKATKKASKALSQSIEQIVDQCASVSCAYLHDDLPEDSLSLGEKDMLRVLDPAMPRTPVEKREDFAFVLRVDADSDDIMRLRYLLTIVFHPFDSHSRTDIPEQVLRRAIWSMADRVNLGISPLGFLASAAILESCLSVYYRYNSRHDGHLATFMTKQLGLSPQHSGALDEVFQKRNRVAHDLAYGICAELVLTTSRLAWASVHHLTAKLSNTAEKPRGRMKTPRDIRWSFERILEDWKGS